MKKPLQQAAPRESKRTLFLSSTFRDLEEHRAAVIRAVEGTGRYRCVVMEHFGAVPRTADDYSRAMVAECEVFVGIIGHTYGSYVPGQNISFTEREYWTAYEGDKPRLMFLASEDVPPPTPITEPEEKRRKQIDFRGRVSLDFIHKTFTSPEDLAAQVLKSLDKWEREESARREHLKQGLELMKSFPPEPYFPYPYLMQEHFVGRLQERRRLTDWWVRGLQPLAAVVALGGMGKSALTWAWLQRDVLGGDLPGGARRENAGRGAARVPRDDCPEGVVWWSFYELKSGFPVFLDHALYYMSGGELNVNELNSLSDKMDSLIGLLRRHRVLLVLDGFEREMRAYSSLAWRYEEEPTAPSLPGNPFTCKDPRVGEFLQRVASLRLRGRILLTSRHRPREMEGIEGVHAFELKSLEPDDAVEFFRARKVQGRRDEIQTACEPYGYHPLSLRLLAGVIANDKEAPGDVSVARRYPVHPDMRGKEGHHIFQVSYRGMNERERQLLSSLAVFRGSIHYGALPVLKIFNGNAELDAALEELKNRGLLQVGEEAPRYDLHPLVRQYAYEDLDAAQRKAVHRRLSRYFARLARRYETKAPGDLTEAIEQYHHTARSEQYRKAYTIMHDQLFAPLHLRFGEYLLNVELLNELFPNGYSKPPRLSEKLQKAVVRRIHAGTVFPPRPGCESARVWAMTALGVSYRVGGFPGRAEELLKAANDISERLGDKESLVVDLINLADVQWTLGRFRAVDENLRRQIALSKEIGSKSHEAVGHQDLGLRLAFRGCWDESERELGQALRLSREINVRHRQAIIWSHKTRKELLLTRAESGRSAGDAKRGALVAANKLLELVELLAPGQTERHNVRALWLLGAAHLVNGDLARAEQYLFKAWAGCRRINLVEFEADILLSMAGYHAAKGRKKKAVENAEAALKIAERSDFVLAAADAHLLLARLALKSRNRLSTRKHAEEAHQWAVCDGPPDYTYKVAYDEALTLLRYI